MLELDPLSFYIMNAMADDWESIAQIEPDVSIYHEPTKRPTIFDALRRLHDLRLLQIRDEEGNRLSGFPASADSAWFAMTERGRHVWDSNCHRFVDAAELTSMVLDSLWRDWDPIGVNESPEAQDEYDSYVSGVCSLLLSGADAHKLRQHLAQIETVAMGLSSPCSHLDDVVQKLLAMVGR